ARRGLALLLRAIQHERHRGCAGAGVDGTGGSANERAGTKWSARLEGVVDVQGHRDAGSWAGISEWNPFTDIELVAAAVSRLAGRAEGGPLFPSGRSGGVAARDR